MKSLHFWLLAAPLSLSLFAACQKDGGPAPNGPDGPGGDTTIVVVPAFEGMSAKINGQLFEPAVADGLFMGDIVRLKGTSGNSTVILNVPDDVLPGTYTFPSNDPNTLSGWYHYSAISSYLSKSGKIVVTKHDEVEKVIAGTFEFVGERIVDSGTVTVTEGKFNIRYN